MNEKIISSNDLGNAHQSMLALMSEAKVAVAYCQVPVEYDAVCRESAFVHLTEVQ
jgi:hypothetical protein